eukprot:GHRQ01023888.1.p1 GENE.GHRQ01023888.1~~GHRQ01023888.1.p1  ORF type:complete len:127 (-),score=12.38 GHRQ01023888.1:87-467(-)
MALLQHGEMQAAASTDERLRQGLENKQFAVEICVLVSNIQQEWRHPTPLGHAHLPVDSACTCAALIVVQHDWQSAAEMLQKSWAAWVTASVHRCMLAHRITCVPKCLSSCRLQYMYTCVLRASAGS